MTRKELEDELRHVEKRRFYLAMIDRWTKEDFKLDDELFKKAQELQIAIKKASQEPQSNDQPIY